MFTQVGDRAGRSGVRGGGEKLRRGFTTKSVDNGIKSTGIFTPRFRKNGFQHYTNGGAHELKPPLGHGSTVLDMTNNGSAGAITVSGFTKVTGDTLAMTSALKYRFFITVGTVGSHLHKQVMQ